MIMQHLDSLLTGSDPGDQMHYLHVIAAPVGAVGPLGLPDESQLKSTVYAIAVDQSVSVQEFVGKVIMAAAVEAAQANTVVQFAALSQEMWTVSPMDELAQRLARQGRMHTHPRAAEVTLVYAAARDGRRWRGRRWLTGPKAGTTENIDLLVGPPQPQESFGITAAPLLRRLVGIM